MSLFFLCFPSFSSFYIFLFGHVNIQIQMKERTNVTRFNKTKYKPAIHYVKKLLKMANDRGNVVVYITSYLNASLILPHIIKLKRVRK